MHVTERGLKRSWMMVDTRMETREEKGKKSVVRESKRNKRERERDRIKLEIMAKTKIKKRSCHRPIKRGSMQKKQQQTTKTDPKSTKKLSTSMKLVCVSIQLYQKEHPLPLFPLLVLCFQFSPTQIPFRFFSLHSIDV